MIILKSAILLIYSAASATLLFEDENCIISDTNTSGKCINIHKCEYGKQLLRIRKLVPTCGFKGNIPLVCCPTPQFVTNFKIQSGTKSRQMCSFYHTKPHRRRLIEMGEKARSKEFPHMAAVGFVGTENKILWLCGGSLISRQFILTAAHCAKSPIYGEPKWVRLGDLDLENTTEESNPQDLQISRVYVHPNYTISSHYNDIALLKIGEVDLDAFVHPACLQTEMNISVEKLEAIGWGKIGYFGDRSSHLMKVNLQFVDFTTCRKRFLNLRKVKDGILEKYQICAGDISGKDTCPGDSGGPLHYKIKQTTESMERFVVAGITSFGKGCGGEYSIGIYTRVSSYIDWIESIVWVD